MIRLPRVGDVAHGLLGWKGRRHVRARRGFWWCCCSSGSGPGSGAGSGESGSDGGSLAGSTAPTTYTACCAIERDTPNFTDPFWSGGAVNPKWPATLTVSLPTACCSQLRGPFTLTAADPSTFGATFWVLYQYQNSSAPTCTGASGFLFFDLYCSSNPATPTLRSWSFRIFADEERFATAPGFGLDPVETLGCDPLHLLAHNITLTNPSGKWCSGTFNAEITE